MDSANPLERSSQGLVVEWVAQELFHLQIHRPLETCIAATKFPVVAQELRRHLEVPTQGGPSKSSSSDSIRRNLPRRTRSKS